MMRIVSPSGCCRHIRHSNPKNDERSSCVQFQIKILPGNPPSSGSKIERRHCSQITSSGSKICSLLRMHTHRVSILRQEHKSTMGAGLCVSSYQSSLMLAPLEIVPALKWCFDASNSILYDDPSITCIDHRSFIEIQQHHQILTKRKLVP